MCYIWWLHVDNLLNQRGCQWHLNDIYIDCSKFYIIFDIITLIIHRPWRFAGKLFHQMMENSIICSFKIHRLIRGSNFDQSPWKSLFIAIIAAQVSIVPIFNRTWHKAYFVHSLPSSHTFTFMIGWTCCSHNSSPALQFIVI